MSEKVFTSNTVGGPISVYVKDGRVFRVRPIAVNKDELKPWTLVDANGKKFSPPKKTTVQLFAVLERTRLYAEDRIKYPMKRVDFDPNGERHPENRGKSKYVRISWDEALDIISGEMKRLRATYGPESITATTSSHHNFGNLNYRLSSFVRFFNTLGHTEILANPDSWEGWHWGATHAYGFYWRLGMPESYDLLEDALKHTDLIIYWGSDPDSTGGVYAGQESVIWRQWLKESGKKQIFIDPYHNYTCAHVADKWIAPRPGTDAALALAIAYVWIEEDTYDKDYIATRTIGFDEFKQYVLGKDDGVPKTPQWAALLTDIPASTIRALAREWGSKKVMFFGAGQGGACRQAYATEWARLCVLLQAMQGLGKPGVSMLELTGGVPYNASLYFPGYADPDGMIWLSRAAKKQAFNPVEQKLYRLLLPDAILNPPIHWTGEGFCAWALDQQFKPYTYPMPGHSEVHMLYRYGSAYIGTMTETNKWIQMYQSPKLEFVVNQDCWWGGETGFADVILPACTTLERDDISEFCGAGGYGGHNNIVNYRVIVRHQKCIEPLWESKPDYEIFSLLAERMGIKEEFTEGKTDVDWIKAMFEVSDLPKITSWEEFNKKGYCIINVPDDYKPIPALRWFYEGRPCDTPDPGNPKKGTDKAHELGTYSGKIEFVSQSLKEHFPDDEERPPLPRYIPSWEGHESKLAEIYPLMLITPHPRYTFHTQHDKHTPWLDDVPGHRTLKDSYAYMTVNIHPSDASKRGIQEGDVIKLYNDRGGVLGAAHLTERVRPGTVHSWSSSGKYDPLEPGKPGSIDRGGCMNILSPMRMVSKNAPGMANNSCLIEIARWEV